MSTLEQLNFSNSFAELPEIFFSEHQPKALKDDFLIHFNEAVAELLALLENDRVDYTLFFRNLSNQHAESDVNLCRNLFLDRAAFDDWFSRYQARLKQENITQKTRCEQMKNVNPKYILRNYMAEIAIRKAQNEHDYSEIKQLVNILQKPFDEHPDFEHYAGHPPEWAQQIEVSCSS